MKLDIFNYTGKHLALLKARTLLHFKIKNRYKFTDHPITGTGTVGFRSFDRKTIDRHNIWPTSPCHRHLGQVFIRL